MYFSQKIKYIYLANGWDTLRNIEPLTQIVAHSYRKRKVAISRGKKVALPYAQKARIRMGRANDISKTHNVPHYFAGFTDVWHHYSSFPIRFRFIYMVTTTVFAATFVT